MVKLKGKKIFIGAALYLHISFFCCFRMRENNNGECIPPVVSTSVEFLRETGKDEIKFVCRTRSLLLLIDIQM